MGRLNFFAKIQVLIIDIVLIICIFAGLYISMGRQLSTNITVLDVMGLEFDYVHKKDGVITNYSFNHDGTGVMWQQDSSGTRIASNFVWVKKYGYMTMRAVEKDYPSKDEFIAAKNALEMETKSTVKESIKANSKLENPKWFKTDSFKIKINGMKLTCTTAVVLSVILGACGAIILAFFILGLIIFIKYRKIAKL